MNNRKSIARPRPSIRPNEARNQAEELQISQYDLENADNPFRGRKSLLRTPPRKTESSPVRSPLRTMDANTTLLAPVAKKPVVNVDEIPIAVNPTARYPYEELLAKEGGIADPAPIVEVAVKAVDVPKEDAVPVADVVVPEKNEIAALPTIISPVPVREATMFKSIAQDVERMPENEPHANITNETEAMTTVDTVTSVHEDSLPIFDDSPAIFRWGKSGARFSTITTTTTTTTTTTERRLSIKDVIQGLREDKVATEKAIVLSVTGILKPQQFRMFVQNFRSPPKKIEDSMSINTASNLMIRDRVLETPEATLLRIIESPKVTSSVKMLPTNVVEYSRPRNPASFLQNLGFDISDEPVAMMPPAPAPVAAKVPESSLAQSQNFRIQKIESIASQLDQASLSVSNMDFSLRRKTMNWVPPKYPTQNKRVSMGVSRPSSVTMGISRPTSVSMNPIIFSEQALDTENPFKPKKTLSYTPHKSDGHVSSNSEIKAPIPISQVLQNNDDDDSDDAELSRIIEDNEAEEVAPALNFPENEKESVMDAVHESAGDLNISKEEIEEADEMLENIQVAAGLQCELKKSTEQETLAAHWVLELQSLRNELKQQKEAFDKVMDDKLALQSRLEAVENKMTDGEISDEEVVHNPKPTTEVPEWYLNSQLNMYLESLRDTERMQADIELRRNRRADRVRAMDKEIHTIWNHFQSKIAEKAKVTAQIMEEIDLNKIIRCPSPFGIKFTNEFVHHADIAKCVRPVAGVAPENDPDFCCIVNDLIRQSCLYAKNSSGEKPLSRNRRPLNSVISTKSAFLSPDEIKASKLAEITKKLNEKKLSEKIPSPIAPSTEEYVNQVEAECFFESNDDNMMDMESNTAIESNYDNFDHSSSPLASSEQVSNVSKHSKKTKDMNISVASSLDDSTLSFVPPMAKGVNMKFKPLTVAPLAYEPSEYSPYDAKSYHEKKRSIKHSKRIFEEYEDDDNEEVEDGVDVEIHEVTKISRGRPKKIQAEVAPAKTNKKIVKGGPKKQQLATSKEITSDEPTTAVSDIVPESKKRGRKRKLAEKVDIHVNDAADSVASVDSNQAVAEPQTVEVSSTEATDKPKLKRGRKASKIVTETNLEVEVKATSDEIKSQNIHASPKVSSSKKIQKKAKPLKESSNIAESVPSVEVKSKKRFSMPKAAKPNATAKSAYTLFALELKPIILQENPDMPSDLVSKEIHRRWKALSPEEKLRWDEVEEKIVVNSDSTSSENFIVLPSSHMVMVPISSSETSETVIEKKRKFSKVSSKSLSEGDNSQPLENSNEENEKPKKKGRKSKKDIEEQPVSSRISISPVKKADDDNTTLAMQDEENFLTSTVPAEVEKSNSAPSDELKAKSSKKPKEKKDAKKLTKKPRKAKKQAESESDSEYEDSSSSNTTKAQEPSLISRGENRSVDPDIDFSSILRREQGLRKNAVTAIISNMDLSSSRNISRSQDLNSSAHSIVSSNSSASEGSKRKGILIPKLKSKKL